MGTAFFLALLAAVALFAVRYLQGQENILRKIQTKNEQVLASQAPELTLLPEERKVLDQTVALDPERPVTEFEKSVLARRVPTGSRTLPGLATPPWDEAQFDSFLKDQEGHYRMPLEWSYRRKLVQLFREHHPSAARAFEDKDYLKARDEWIRSLALPVYQQDLKKHRGVVLTLLQPYINDTLSKIGTLNAMLTEKELYAGDEMVQSDYEMLHTFLQNDSWEEAHARVLELRQKMEAAQQAPRSIDSPPLPKEVSLIDSDIREILLAQIQPREFAARDWEALRSDLEDKEKVIQNHLPGALEEIQRQYAEALIFIRNGNWQDARALLQRITFPEVLAEDAKAKVKVLDPLIGRSSPSSPVPSLDSNEQTG